MVDVTATVLALAGGSVPGDWDGIPIPFEQLAVGAPLPGRYPNWPTGKHPLRQS